jgi:membrane-bound lytic murein transglycosylase A
VRPGLIGRSLLALGVGLALVTAGCVRRVPRPVTDPALAMRPARAVALADDGDRASLREAIDRSLEWLATQPADRPLVFGPRTLSAAEQAETLRQLRAVLADDPPAEALDRRLRERFDLLQAVGGEDGRMLVTGYYEPIVEAAERPSATFRVPVLGVPDDLVEVPLEPFALRFRGERIAGRLVGRRLVPYWTRAEIEGGRLADRGLEIAWGRDPVDVFFMEIQGSGTLRLPDGREVRVGYAASNGRPYRSIGRLLIDEGQLARDEVTMPAIRTWLRANPGAVARVLHYNESYVFFRRLDGPPVGSLGVPVTAGRSIALDMRLFPPGALAFLSTERPERRPDGTIVWRPLHRLVVNQDTGGAIRGPDRVDLFWGRGPEAELAAGLMKQPGSLYFLVPRARYAKFDSGSSPRPQ